MKSLPINAIAYRQTPIFNQETIPNGLLHAHRTKAGSWGKIVVVSGNLIYRILTPIPEEYILHSQFSGIVEPQIPHEVKPIGVVEFYVEFYRERID